MMHSLRTLALALAVSAAPLALTGPAVAQDAAELLLRLDRLENLVRQLNGQVEQAQNQNRRLEEQLRRFQGDTDFRFKELEGGRAPRPSPAPGTAPAPQPGTQPPRQQRGDAFDPNANPQATGAPQQLGSPGSASTPPRRPAGSDVVQNPGQIIAGQENAIGRDPRDPQSLTPPPRGPQAGNPPPAGPPATAQAAVELGRAQLRDGKYDDAEQTFREFTRARPRDRLMPDALMGLGDSYFQRQRWREAAEQFVDVTTKHPKSGRAAEAELKLGISLRGLGAAKEACDVLTNHAGKYPAASAGIKQGVQRELQRARCGG